MNSARLKYFLAVSETKSVRKASEILNLSPATLSRAIKCLEDELGQTLLIPKGRGIEITRLGEDLAKKSRPLLLELDNLKKEIKQQSALKPKDTIRLGSFEIFTTYFLRHIASILPQETIFTLKELLPGDMEKNLLLKEIDYAITYLPLPLKDISHKCIGFVSMNIFARQGQFQKTDLRKLPFVVPLDSLSDLSHSSNSLDGWPYPEINRWMPYRVSLLESAIELCRQGRAVAYLPHFIADLHNQISLPQYHLSRLFYKEFQTLEKRPIYLIKRQNDPEDSFFKELESALSQICEENLLVKE
jgi:DNA-binding transcriptional LysR family regulator